MKKRQKALISAALLIVLALSVMFTACDSGSPIVLEGKKFSINGATVDGVTISKSDIVATMGETIYDFKADGVVTVTLDGVSGDGTYTQNGKDGTISNPESGITINITIYSSTFTYEQDGIVVEYAKV